MDKNIRKNKEFAVHARKPPAKKSPGRPKGSPNKLTTDIRAMIISALDKAGGEDYLLKQATENPNAFMTLIGKIIPTQITGDKENPLRMIHEIPTEIMEMIKNR